MTYLNSTTLTDARGNVVPVVDVEREGAGYVATAMGDHWSDEGLGYSEREEWYFREDGANAYGLRLNPPGYEPEPRSKRNMIIGIGVAVFTVAVVAGVIARVHHG